MPVVSRVYRWFVHMTQLANASPTHCPTYRPHGQCYPVPDIYHRVPHMYSPPCRIWWTTRKHSWNATILRLRFCVSYLLHDVMDYPVLMLLLFSYHYCDFHILIIKRPQHHSASYSGLATKVVRPHLHSPNQGSTVCLLVVIYVLTWTTRSQQTREHQSGITRRGHRSMETATLYWYAI